LLKDALERCDAEEKLAYLEASSRRSVPLYQRHGFQVTGTIQEGSSPPLFPMVRKPRRFEARRNSGSFALQGNKPPAGMGLMAR
jgi:hypothetical protein